MAEAREAVRRVRAARGYFAPESAKGKGMAGSASSSPTRSPSKGSRLGGKGKDFGGCFTCGLPGHSYRQCPDRFASGKGKPGVGKGFFGKSGKFGGKFGGKKGKGPSKSVQYHDLTLPGIFMNDISQSTRVVLDTGASENAVGVEALRRLVEDATIQYKVDVMDRPVFKFGNGHQAQAKSRVDLFNTSLGHLYFYVLGDEAHLTPPLLGGKTLRKLKGMLSYEFDLLIFKSQGAQNWNAVKLHALPSHHVAVDLRETSTPMSNPGLWFVSEAAVHDHVENFENDKDEVIFMLGRAPPLQNRLSALAQRLRQVQSLGGCDGQSPDSMCRGRSEIDRIPMLSTAPREDPAEPVRPVDDMPEVRIETVLCDEGQEDGRVPAYGTTPQFG